MCEVGWRVKVPPEASTDEQGRAVAPWASGIVIGHIGFEWAIVSLDDRQGMVLVREGRAIPRPGTKTSAVVVQPDGSASGLSRRDSQRVRVRPRK